MKNWKLPTHQQVKYPFEVLQEYADSLIKITNGLLAGQVTEAIINDPEERPKIYYALHIYLTKIKQSYRLFEIEQITEYAYPVNLKVIFYTGAQEIPDLKSDKDLEQTLDGLISSPGVSNLIGHFLRLSELKEE